MTTCLKVEIRVEMGKVLMEETSSTRVVCDVVFTVSTSAQATATAAIKWEEWSVARGDMTSSIVVLITLLDPVSQELEELELETAAQSEPRAVTSLGQVESRARRAEARCSPLCFLRLELEPPSTCTRLVIREVWWEVRVEAGD